MKYSPSTRGFYCFAIHGENIPTDAIEITDTEYRALLDGQTEGKAIVPGVDGSPVLFTPVVTFEQAFDATYMEILRGSDAILNAATRYYSASEKASWSRQEAEARALSTDENAPAPLLRTMATVRGITVGELAGKVLTQAAQWEAFAGYILGQQQAFEDALNACGTVEEINAVTVTYSLPD
jgi:hypothetical protein